MVGFGLGFGWSNFILFRIQNLVFSSSLNDYKGFKFKKLTIMNLDSDLNVKVLDSHTSAF